MARLDVAVEHSVYCAVGSGGAVDAVADVAAGGCDVTGEIARSHQFAAGVDGDVWAVDFYAGICAGDCAAGVVSFAFSCAWGAGEYHSRSRSALFSCGFSAQHKFADRDCGDSACGGGTSRKWRDGSSVAAGSGGRRVCGHVKVSAIHRKEV